MAKKHELTEQQKQEIAIYYRNTLSVIGTAKTFSLGKNFTRKLLKTMGVLLTLSQYASQRTGCKNSFFGKKHKEETKKKHSEYMSEKVGKLNPNYKDGKYTRRPRDFKIAQFKPLRSFVFNRDKYTCVITGQVGGHLHAHHLIPYWVCPEAFFDADNIITVSTEAHFNICHKNDWARFNADLVSDKLLQKYSIDRERLNELADLHNKSEAIVRSADITETAESSRNI